MTLDEAIKRLEQHKSYLESLHALEQVEAHQLGIEALKLLKGVRLCLPGSAAKLLPGETKGHT